MSKGYFNPSMRHDLHFHDNWGDHECPANKCEYIVFDDFGYRIVYCKNCGQADRRKL